jgi:nucleoside-diphosphate-sugar epimerase
MLRDRKILVTGPAGQIAFPLARALAKDNEVWGVARFRAPGSREAVEAAGIVARSCDLTTGRFDGVPEDFDTLLHLAAFQAPGEDYDAAIRTNAEATGLLLQHCRRASSALVMSTHAVYRPVDDPLHAYAESSALGDAHAVHSPTYSISKIAQEAVARTSARLLGLPVVIARMNAAYGPGGGLPILHLDAIASDRSVSARWDPAPYQPIHDDDILAQLEPMLGAASVPATIVNWAGDEIVTVQQWCAAMGELLGRPARVETRPVPGTHRGLVADVGRRRAIAGPCRVHWKDGIRRAAEARGLL